MAIFAADDGSADLFLIVAAFRCTLDPSTAGETSAAGEAVEISSNRFRRVPPDSRSMSRSESGILSRAAST